MIDVDHGGQQLDRGTKLHLGEASYVPEPPSRCRAATHPARVLGLIAEVTVVPARAEGGAIHIRALTVRASSTHGHGCGLAS